MISSNVAVQANIHFLIAICLPCVLLIDIFHNIIFGVNFPDCELLSPSPELVGLAARSSVPRRSVARR